MTYATVQTGFSAVIQKISGYDSNNVAEADRRILGHGHQNVVILYPGAFQQREATLKDMNLVTWQTQIQLYRLNDGEISVTVGNLVAEREKIIAELQKWPHLDAVSGVMDALIVSGGEIEEIEGTQYLRTVLVGQTIEAQSFTRSE